MNRRKGNIILLCVSVICFFLFAFSFLLMPMELTEAVSDREVITLIAGGLFWLSLLGGIVTQIVLSARVKKWYKINRLKRVGPSNRIGLISFFKNKAATVFDILMMVGLILFITFAVLTDGMGNICYVFLSVFIFSFSMHCILNGRIYYHIKNENKILKVVQKERANTARKERN